MHNDEGDSNFMEKRVNVQLLAIRKLNENLNLTLESHKKIPEFSPAMAKIGYSIIKKIVTTIIRRLKAPGCL